METWWAYASVNGLEWNLALESAMGLEQKLAPKSVLY